MILKHLEQSLANSWGIFPNHHYSDLEQVTVHQGVKFPHQQNAGVGELISGRSPLA